MLNARKSISLLSILVLAIAAASSASRDGKDKNRDDRNVRDDKASNSAVVSFGEWMTTPPLDRFPNLSPNSGNHHLIIPNQVKIKVGGTVNFVIAGLHEVIVYDDGTQPGDIDTNLTRNTTGTPAGIPLINDPNKRIYAGPDPSLLPQDRVEVVLFSNPGTFLVICGVKSHFVNDKMFGFVKVVPNRPEDDDNNQK